MQGWITLACSTLDTIGCWSYIWLLATDTCVFSFIFRQQQHPSLFVLSVLYMEYGTNCLYDVVLYISTLYIYTVVVVQ